MSVNDDLFDREVSHQIHVLRLSSGMAARIVALLERTEADLLGQLLTRLDKVKRRGFDAGPETTKRLEQMIVGVQAQRSTVYSRVGSELREELEEFADYERNWQRSLLGNTVSAVGLQTVTPPLQQVYAAAFSRPVQGRLLKEWVKDLEADDARRLRDEIRIGFVEGQTTPQIVSRVRPILDTSKRHATTIVRTAVNHTANSARSLVALGNEDIIKGVRWVSTLDGRTSPICQARDGKVYAVDKGPRPPAHPNCRSTITYVLKGLSGGGTRASFDGQVPADLTYNEWLKKQPRATVEDILGSTRAKLFLKGKLPVSKFVDRSGRQYTLADLKRREPEAYTKAVS